MPEERAIARPTHTMAETSSKLNIPSELTQFHTDITKNTILRNIKWCLKTLTKKTYLADSKYRKNIKDYIHTHLDTIDNIVFYVRPQ